MRAVIVERVEGDYPVLALRCHDLVDAAREFLSDGAEKIARTAAAEPQAAAYVRTLADYYAKLHTVINLPVIFLRVTRAVWAATNDIQAGLQAIEDVESALRAALDMVSVAAVEAGLRADDASVNSALYEPSIYAGVHLVTTVVFDVALNLIEE